MNMPFVLLSVAWLIVAAVVLRNDTPLAIAFKPRLVTLLGVVFVLGSFLFLPWLRVDVAGYMDVPGSEPLKAALPTALSLFGIEQLKDLLDIVQKVTSPNGWQLQAIPVYDLPTRLAASIPALIGVCTIFWLPWGTTFSGGRLCKFVGAVLVVLSALAILGLVNAIPALDAMVVPGWQLALLHEPWNGLPSHLPAVLIGIRLSSGPWLTIAGLCLVLLGGLVEIFHTRSKSSGISPDQEQIAWPA